MPVVLLPLSRRLRIKLKRVLAQNNLQRSRSLFCILDPFILRTCAPINCFFDFHPLKVLFSCLFAFSHRIDQNSKPRALAPLQASGRLGDGCEPFTPVVLLEITSCILQFLDNYQVCICFDWLQYLVPNQFFSCSVVF